MESTIARSMDVCVPPAISLPRPTGTPAFRNRRIGACPGQVAVGRSAVGHIDAPLPHQRDLVVTGPDTVGHDRRAVRPAEEAR